jgi:hypothetical protein
MYCGVILYDYMIINVSLQISRKESFCCGRDNYDELVRIVEVNLCLVFDKIILRSDLISCLFDSTRGHGISSLYALFYIVMGHHSNWSSLFFRFLEQMSLKLYLNKSF